MGKGDWLEALNDLEGENLGGLDLDDCETWSDLVNILNIVKQRGPEKFSVGVEKEERQESLQGQSEGNMVLP